MKLRFLKVYSEDANGEMHSILIGVNKISMIQGWESNKKYKSYLSIGKSDGYYCEFTVQEVVEKCNIELVS